MSGASPTFVLFVNYESESDPEDFVGRFASEGLALQALTELKTLYRIGNSTLIPIAAVDEHKVRGRRIWTSVPPIHAFDAEVGIADEADQKVAHLARPYFEPQSGTYPAGWEVDLRAAVRPFCRIRWAVWATGTSSEEALERALACREDALAAGIGQVMEAAARVEAEALRQTQAELGPQPYGEARTPQAVEAWADRYAAHFQALLHAKALRFRQTRSGGPAAPPVAGPDGA